MKNLLHIIATPRGDESRTLQVSEAFLEAFAKRNPGSSVDILNVATAALPPLTVKAISGKYLLLGGKDLPAALKPAWEPVEREITRFLAADGYLVSTPMWNFGIPYPLKHYIDIILQPRYLFRYTEQGVEGLVRGKKMVVITSRGGDYSQASPLRSYDHQEPYLRTVFGFVGIRDITFINAQPMDALGPVRRDEEIGKAKAAARTVAASW